MAGTVAKTAYEMRCLNRVLPLRTFIPLSDEHMRKNPVSRTSDTAGEHQAIKLPFQSSFLTPPLGGFHVQTKHN
jgi:hypothetical protein